MKVKFLDLQKINENANNNILNIIEDTIKNNNYIEVYKETEFENNFKHYCGSQFCLALNSGTDALLFSILSLDLPEKSEILLPSYTFAATAESVVLSGHIPVFVDINSDDYFMNLKELQSKINAKTKAVICVDLYGEVQDNIYELKRVCQENSLFLIEDACQAHGATIKNVKSGTFGDIGCFSFYPGKNLGAFGDGGAVVTNNEKFYNHVKLLRNHGMDKKYYHDICGYNSRLDMIQQNILNFKLKFLDFENLSRINASKQYYEQLKNNDNIVLPNNYKENNVFHLFTIQVKDVNKRELLEQYLNKNGIDTGRHYPIPLHKQKAFYQNVELINTEYKSDRIISLPMHPYLSKEEIMYVCQYINKFFEVENEENKCFS